DLRRPAGAATYTIGGAAAGDARALPIDSLVCSFLDTTKKQRPASVQNGLAALVFRTALSAGGAGTGRSILIAPPRRWTAPASELTVFLQTMQDVVTAGLAVPQPLAPLVSGSPGGTSTGLDYSAHAG